MKTQSAPLLLHEQKKIMHQIRWLIFWVLISLNVVTLSVDAVFTFLPEDIKNSSIINSTVMMFTHILAVLLPLIIFFRLREKGTVKISLRLNKIPFKQIIVIIILAITGQFIVAISDIPMQLLVEPQPFPVPIGVFEIALAILAIAMVPAILEEILFRGIIFGGMEKQSTIFAAIFSTFIFALLHPNILSFVGYIFLGFIIVMVMLRTNSLYAAILYHFIYNLTAVLFGIIAGQTQLTTSFIIWLLLSSIVVFIVTIFIFRIVTPNALRYKTKNPTPLLLGNIFSIPIMLCIVLTIFIQYFRLFG